MGRRSIIKRFQVMSAEDSTSDPESSITDVSSVDFITYEITVGALVDATLEVQVRNEESASFKALNFNQTLTLDGSSDTDYMVHIENKGFKDLKLSITDNGGSGDISAWVSGTVRGA
jgi:hypothetical protein